MFSRCGVPLRVIFLQMEIREEKARAEEEERIELERKEELEREKLRLLEEEKQQRIREEAAREAEKVQAIVDSSIAEAEVSHESVDDCKSLSVFKMILCDYMLGAHLLVPKKFCVVAENFDQRKSSQIINMNCSDQPQPK